MTRRNGRKRLRQLGVSLRRCAPLLVFATAVGVAFGTASCGKKTELPPAPVVSPDISWLGEIPEGRWSFLLLTLDTTREDALGCYGKENAGTPVLDSLAAEGVLFEDVATSVPMTCPAHATILTGLDPHEHGVRDNGRYIAADTLLTLAEMFREKGYQTAAFLAAFPLDSQFGLDQGFDVYDDRYTERVVAGSAETSQRRADGVTDATLEWVREHRGRPFFLWAHYFDPHFPYDAPEPYAGRFPESAYQAEVAYMDAEIGRLLGELRRMGVMDSTFILAVGDHGESLGEHGEDTHSFFVYDETQMVPCILVPPSRWAGGASLVGRRIGWHARLRDMTATVANLMGWPKAHWQGIGTTSLLPVLQGGDPPPRFVSYIETLVPYLEYGWSDLRGVRSQNWKYIRAPRPELYDLVNDPAETVNVVSKYPEAVSRLEAWLDWYLANESEAAQRPAELDPETVERLRSLGYLHGGGAGEEGSGADPKDRLDAFKAVMQARTYASQFRPQEAISLLEPVVRQEPDNLELLNILATTYAQARKLEKADDLYDQILKKAPTEPRYLKESAELALMEGNYERAFELLDVLEGSSPDEEGIWILRGDVWEAQEDWERAKGAYNEEISRFPESFVAYSRIGRVFRRQEDPEGAREAFEKALEFFPKHAESLAALASLALEAEDTPRGDSLLALALDADPFSPEANFLRGWKAKELNDLFTARDCFDRAARASPEFAQAHYGLANVHLKLGNWQIALQGYENALALNFESVELRTNQGVAYAQMGRLDKAVESWERALELGPDAWTAQGLRQNLQRARQALGGR